jgi:hypothetical protein
MTISITNLTSGSEVWTVETNDTIAVASSTVPNNSVAVLTVAAASGSSANMVNVETPTTSGLTWNLAGTVDYGSRRSLWVYYAINASGSGVTAATSAVVENVPYAIQEAIWSLDLIEGVDTTTPFGTVTTNSGAGATSGAVTVTGTPDAGDYVWLSFVHTGASSDRTINGELSNEILELGGGTNVRRILTAYDSTPDASPVPGVSWSGAEDWGGVAFIVNVGAGGGPAYTPRSMLLGVG